MPYKKVFEIAHADAPKTYGEPQHALIFSNADEELFAYNESPYSYYLWNKSSKLVGIYQKYETAEAVIGNLRYYKVTKLEKLFKNGRRETLWKINDEIKYKDKSQVIMLNDKYYSIETLEEILKQKRVVK